MPPPLKRKPPTVKPPTVKRKPPTVDAPKSRVSARFILFVMALGGVVGFVGDDGGSEQPTASAKVTARKPRALSVLSSLIVQ